jgi:hypothetical protein
MNTYDVGDLVRIDATFTVDATATDPTTVICRVKAPDGTVSAKTYGTDAEVVKESTAGVYHLDIDITQRGTWRYRWEGTGAAQGAEEGRFDVRRSGVLT